ncbi:MAG: hypothetical protein ACODAD_03990 [Planctomycetota bacterium]
MTNEPVSQVRLVLGNHEGMGRITVELEPFFEFSFWMAEELQDLVAANKQFTQPPESRQIGALRGVD